MRRRVFVALNLEKGALDSIEKLVSELQPKFAAVPKGGVRFASRENWHLTVSFLGYQEENDIPRIIDAMRRTAKNFGEQEIVFRKVLYGPARLASESVAGRPPHRTPRMIWLLADSDNSRELARLKTTLEDNLEKSGVGFKREIRPFTGHLTLARFMSENALAQPLPPLARDINIESVSRTLDLMESELKRGGAEYAVLQKTPLDLSLNLQT